MSDIDRWISECRLALAQAERLAAQLGRLPGGEALRVGELTMRIANLRAALEALDAMRALSAPPVPPPIHPDWMSLASPWCPPDGEA